MFLLFLQRKYRKNNLERIETAGLEEVEVSPSLFLVLSTSYRIENVLIFYKCISQRLERKCNVCTVSMTTAYHVGRLSKCAYCISYG